MDEVGGGGGDSTRGAEGGDVFVSPTPAGVSKSELPRRSPRAESMEVEFKRSEAEELFSMLDAPMSEVSEDVMKTLLILYLEVFDESIDCQKFLSSIAGSMPGESSGKTAPWI